MEEKKDTVSQDIKLSMREKLDVSGVIDVVRFDDLCVVLLTTCGELTIDGKNLKIYVLDTDKGIVSLEGSVDSLYYSDDSRKEKRGIFSKIFA